MEEPHFDLIVFGTGGAGQVVAYGCREAGWSVAAIDCREPGGTCANRGCDAKKPLVNAAAAVQAGQRLTGRGVDRGTRIDWRDLIRFKRSFTDPIPDRTRQDLTDAGIELIEGQGRFVDARTVAVEGRRMSADHFVIATGMKPRPLEMPGADRVLTSDDFLNLEALPRRIAFIGAGYISFEFAHAAARAGAHCTLLEQNPRPLQAFDAGLVERLMQASEEAGIRIVCNSCVTCLEQSDDGLTACCEPSGTRYDADLLVHGAGRVPSLDALDLAAAGIEHDSHGVVVDPHLRSVSHAAVFAAGDCASSGLPQLTPVADLEGDLVRHNLLHPQHQRPLDRGPVPAVVFTEPPLAMVGLTEAQARKQGAAVEVREADGAKWKVYREMGVAHAASKVVLEKETGKILGAHLLGPHAEEVINLFALAMRQRLTAEALRRVPWAYPTVTSYLPRML